MANIRLAIGGLDDYPDYVASLMPPIQRAFSQLGVNLQLIRGPRLSSDPANTNSWPALMQQLDQAARNAGGNFPAHLFITDTAPSHDPTINGQLLHRLRGASAVFFGAGIYEPLGPRHNPALVSQVCMHEIGHLLNLTHDDGEPEPDGPPYSSAMMQADEREQQPVPMAWQAAAADAQARGEPALDIPNPLGIYPFSTRCRACLRAAAGNAAWWPWQSKFRGGEEHTNDESGALEVDVTLDKTSRTVFEGGALYFHVRLRNRIPHPLDLPLHISPEHGTLRVRVTGPTGTSVTYVPPTATCSGARRTLLPRKRIVRSFAITGDEEAALFAAPGAHMLDVQVVDQRGTKPASLGRASVRFTVEAAAQATELGMNLSRVIRYGKVADPEGLASHARENSGFAPALALHLDHAIRLSLPTDRKARRAKLDPVFAASAPVAVRHEAALRMAIERLQRGEDHRKVEARLHTLFRGEIHEELFEAFARAVKGTQSTRKGISR